MSDFPSSSVTATALADEIDAALTEYIATIDEQAYSSRRIKAVRAVRAVLWDNRAGIIAHLRSSGLAQTPAGWLDQIEQRLNESGTGEMGLLDTIHAVAAIVREARTSVHAQEAREQWAKLSASEVACYRWPEDTSEHLAIREAFCDGAAHSVSSTDREGK